MRWNHLVLALAVGVVIEAVAALLLALLFERGTVPRFQFFTLAFLCLLFVPLPFALWGLIKSWLVFWLFERIRMKRIFLAYLYKLDFPSSKTHSETETYLLEVAADRIRPEKVRLAATKMLGELSATRDLKPFTRGIQVFIAFNDALAEYDKPPTVFSDMKDRALLE